jgi:hypothetical protein
MDPLRACRFIYKLYSCGTQLVVIPVYAMKLKFNYLDTATEICSKAIRVSHNRVCNVYLDIFIADSHIISVYYVYIM